MKLYYPDFYREFRCLAGACPDSCCRQGWQIVLDDTHKAFYSTLPGELGQRVRDAMTKNEEGETVLRMEQGVCTLLEADGLCPIAAEIGEEGLCHICHTHPRFIEEYGGTREYHLSLSCPEAARLGLKREAPIRFMCEITDEEVTGPNEIDPEEYLTLLSLRETALCIAQDRRCSIYDRMALLLQLGRRLQRQMDDGKYKTCRSLLDVFPHELVSGRMIAGAKRLRLKGTSWFAERELFLSLEHLTEEFPTLLRSAVFTARDGGEFDRACGRTMEHLLSLWLSHYIPKAVNDGRVDTKIRFCVLLCLTVRRLCICRNDEDAAGIAGLLAKELEHSEENVAAIMAALSNHEWHDHLLMQLPLPKEGDQHAI